MKNWNLENAQQELKKRRRQDGVNGTPKPVGDLVDAVLKEPRAPKEPRTIKPDKVPERVTLNSLEITHPKMQTAIDAARAWAERKRDGQLDASLVLMGPYGTGKTHIARAILWSMIQVAVDDDGSQIGGTERPAGRFFTGNDLIQRLDSHTWASSLIGQAPILVIDDVGAEQRIDYAGNDDGQRREKQGRYFKVINYCYDFQVSVIITTNLGLDGLRECVGGRAWSRLAQMAPKGFMLDLTDVPDYRLRQSGR